MKQKVVDTVRNVLRDYDKKQLVYAQNERNATSIKTRRRCGAIFRNEKLCKPSITSSELQQRLLLDCIVHPVDLPSKSATSKCKREDLVMTK